MRSRDNILLRYFFNRTDCVAVLAPWGKPCPVDARGRLEELVDVHLNGNRRRPLKVSRLDSKSCGDTLIGCFRIGAYAPDVHGNTRWFCIDIDGAGHGNAVADPLAVALAIKQAFEERGITTHLELSGGGHGWHLWIFFSTPVSAAKVRLLALRLIPRDIPLATGGTADPARGIGVEVFPKQDRIATNGYGNLVWLPWWAEAKGDANQFHRCDSDGICRPCQPTEFETVDEAVIDRVLVATEPEPTPIPKPPESKPARSTAVAASWEQWRRDAVSILPLEHVYGDWLTGRQKSAGWLECRDPDSGSGDRHPSAGIADGTGEAERGSFHSFISSRTISVFDFLIEQGNATDFKDACRIVAELSGVARPKRVSA